MRSSGNQKAKNNRLIPNSFKYISSCIKTVSSNVRSAGASVAGSISGDSEQQKDQVLWACFDTLYLGLSTVKHVLLLGYSNGFQVLDVEDSSNVSELVSRRDGPVTFLQMLPSPAKSAVSEGIRASHPLLLVVGVDDEKSSPQILGGREGLFKDAYIEPQTGSVINPPTTVSFYSLRSHKYIHILRFRSTVYMVRCSPQVVAVGLAAQIHCFDALTLETKFSVLTYPLSQLGGQGLLGVNIGYGPMAVGSRWLAYASNSPLLSNSGRLSPQNLTLSPGVSPSTSPNSGNLVARYAKESSKQLAAGLINLGDMGYKTLSKYYQDLRPDGSNSPLPSNLSQKTGLSGAHSTEAETSGIVVIKDIESRAIVSQFRAHTSPISALCFDPSGTLLVTASVHGQTINVFRIMPSCSKNTSGSLSYDWSSAHVHLYKLHRGMTPAVIQDINFSHYSQWVAIVSTRGTCHIFVLSPFGGETGLQIQSSSVNGTKILPSLSPPWWYTPSLIMNPLPPVPPPLISLSVVSRIKSVTGWMNTVSNAAASAAGKVSIPSGAVTAIFHNSVLRDVQPAQSNVIALEYLLVYTPSGHLIQHKLLPFTWEEPSENTSKTGPGFLAHLQEEELHMKVEPVQWWDVCRRTDWPEKEESFSVISDGKEAKEIRLQGSKCEDKDSLKSKEQTPLYLSNAEVQISSGRIPIVQKSKVHFHTMDPSGANDSHGEIEIEKVLTYEVELRRKNLLPAVDRFQKINSTWNDRGGLSGVRFLIPSSQQEEAIEKLSEDAGTLYPKVESPDSAAILSSGQLRTAPFHVDLDSVNAPPWMCHLDENNERQMEGIKFVASSLPEQRPYREANPVLPIHSTTDVSPVSHMSKTNVSTSKIDSLSSKQFVAREIQPPNSVGTSDVSNTSSNCSDLSMNILDEGTTHDDALDYEPYFKEGYYKASDVDANELVQVVTDVDSSNGPCDKEKSEEDEEADDDMFGDVFALSEEG